VSIDWRRLHDVRERRRALALEAVAEDRRGLERSEAGVRAAEATLEASRAAQSSHWQAAREAPGLSVAQLGAAAAWSRALDRRIADEGAAVAEARARAEASARVLEASREALRRAAGGVEKATRMGERAQSLRRRLEDLRLESAAEEIAATRWRRDGGEDR